MSLNIQHLRTAKSRSIFGVMRGKLVVLGESNLAHQLFWSCNLAYASLPAKALRLIPVNTAAANGKPLEWSRLQGY